MQTQTCSKCNFTKPVSEFYHSKSSKTGFNFQCKKCLYTYFSHWRKCNRQKANIIEKRWRDSHPETVIRSRKSFYKNHQVEQQNRAKKFYYEHRKECIATTRRWQYRNKERHYASLRRWQKNHPEKYNSILSICRKNWKKKHLATPKGRLDENMSYGIRKALLSKKAGRHWESILGYTVNDLYKHLESKFVEGMSWNNYGGWHIDHIIPRCFFQYSSPNDPEFLYCWSLNNLQPLWAKDNLLKHNKIIRGKECDERKTAKYS